MRPRPFVSLGARLEELKDVAIDGLPGDFERISVDDGLRSQLTEHYDLFRQAIVDRKSADLLSAWIAAQQAWNEFFDRETSFDSHTPLPDWTSIDSSSKNKFVSRKGLEDGQLYLKAFTRLDQTNLADLRNLASALGLSPDPAPEFFGTDF
jgi:hypothetical protein